MLVYDVTREGSFNNIKNWMKRVEDFCPINVPKIIVAAKSDLEDKRLISRDRGKTFASECGIDFVETSAKTGDKVYDSFFKIASKSVKEVKVLQPKPPVEIKVGHTDPIDIDQKEEISGSCCAGNYCSRNSN